MLSLLLIALTGFADDCTIQPGEMMPNGKPCKASCCRAKGECMYNFDTEECLDAADDPCLEDDDGNVCLETCCASKPPPCFFSNTMRQCISPLPSDPPTGPPTSGDDCVFEEYLPKTTTTCGTGGDGWMMQSCTGSTACFKGCPAECLAQPKCNYMNRADKGCNMFEMCDTENPSTTVNEARTFKKVCGVAPSPCPCGKDLEEKVAELEKELAECQAA